MPYYHKLGKLPAKRHTQFRKPNGDLFSEQLFSTEGFSSVYSILYHHHAPTIVNSIDKSFSVEPKVAYQKQMQHRSLQGFNVKPQDDYLDSRKALMVNNDVHISVAAPRKSMTNYFFKNADADEMIFIHVGSGTLKTMYGNLDFEYGDYVMIPRGTIYQIHFKDENNRLLIVESFSPIVPPKRYLNNVGQLLEHSPYYERDIKVPETLETQDEERTFLL